ncbi:hypothetical protein NLJ89_g10699 [Agrocybe chaxingu]|uniref:Transposase n=1 Tax=Agrocybe chaxingu TaxID=84603 RepID=A0A9W8JTS0_9AGAR|nr:hypothetical protein NLJ89_g10699 [Agrocybe chaxingu]
MPAIMSISDDDSPSEDDEDSCSELPKSISEPLSPMLEDPNHEIDMDIIFDLNSACSETEAVEPPPPGIQSLKTNLLSWHTEQASITRQDPDCMDVDSSSDSEPKSAVSMAHPPPEEHFVEDNDEHCYPDWDTFEYGKDGLSAWDTLGESYEREATSIADKLNAYDRAICRAFSFKLQTHLTDKGYAKAPMAFQCNPPLPKIDSLRARVAFLAGFKPERNKKRTEEMQYRAKHIHEPGNMTDVFDGSAYQDLLTETVKIDGEDLGHTYFSDGRDIALGLSTDGFAPFKRRKNTAWPLILFNFNLPPEFRFHMNEILALGVIPGPKKPIDIDSFLWPAILEFIKLVRGVAAFDILKSEMFALRAFLILVFGDIPAVALLMHMKGHNGFSPCRMCKILGIRCQRTKS